MRSLVCEVSDPQRVLLRACPSHMVLVGVLAVACAPGAAEFAEVVERMLE